MFDLSDRVIVVTGATGLLGKQHVDAIAAFGGNPVLIDLNEVLVKNLAQDLNDKYGVSATGFAVDITNENAIKTNMHNLLDKVGLMDWSTMLPIIRAWVIKA